MKYYSVNIDSFSKNGYSVPVSVDTDEELTPDEVVEIAIERGDLDAEETKLLSSVGELDEEDWKLFTKC